MAGRREYGSRRTGGTRTTTAQANVRARTPKEMPKRDHVVDAPIVSTNVMVTPPTAPTVAFDVGTISIIPPASGEILNRKLNATDLPKQAVRLTAEDAKALRLKQLEAFAERAEEIEVRDPATFSDAEKKEASAYMSGLVDEIDTQIARDARRNPRLIALRFVSWLNSVIPAVDYDDEKRANAAASGNYYMGNPFTFMRPKSKAVAATSSKPIVDYTLRPTLAELYYPLFTHRPLVPEIAQYDIDPDERLPAQRVAELEEKNRIIRLRNKEIRKENDLIRTDNERKDKERVAFFTDVMKNSHATVDPTGQYLVGNITDAILTGIINRGDFNTVRQEYTMENYTMGDVLRTLLPWNVLNVSGKPMHIKVAERNKARKAAAETKAQRKAQGLSRFVPDWFKALAPVQAAIAFAKEPSKYVYTPREIFGLIKAKFASIKTAKKESATTGTKATAAASTPAQAATTTPPAIPAAARPSVLSRARTAIRNKVLGVTDENHLKGRVYLNQHTPISDTNPVTSTETVAQAQPAAARPSFLSRVRTAIRNKVYGVTDENNLKGRAYLNQHAPSQPEVKPVTFGDRIASLRTSAASMLTRRNRGMVATGLASLLAVTMTATGMFSDISKSKKPSGPDVAAKPVGIEMKTTTPAAVTETCPSSAAQLASLLPDTTAPQINVIVATQPTPPAAATVATKAPAEKAPAAVVTTAPNGRVATTSAPATKKPNHGALKAQVAKEHVAKTTPPVAQATTHTDHGKTAKAGHAPAATKVRNVPQELTTAFGMTQAQFDNMSPKDQDMLRTVAKSGAATHVEYTPIKPEVAGKAAVALLITARNLSGDMTNPARNAAAIQMYEQAMRLGREAPKMYDGEFLPVEIGKYAFMNTGVPGVEPNDNRAGAAIALAHPDSAYAKRATKILMDRNPQALEAGVETANLLKQYKLLRPFSEIAEEYRSELGLDNKNTPLHPAKKTTSQALQKTKMAHLAGKPSPKM